MLEISFNITFNNFIKKVKMFRIKRSIHKVENLISNI